MKPKDYINKKAQEEALKAFGATQLNNNQESSPYFVGKINASRTKITDPNGKEYDLIFTGNPKEYELAQRLSDSKAVVNAQTGAKFNVDGEKPIPVMIVSGPTFNSFFLQIDDKILSLDSLVSQVTIDLTNAIETYIYPTLSPNGRDLMVLKLVTAFNNNSSQGNDIITYLSGDYTGLGTPCDTGPPCELLEIELDEVLHPTFFNSSTSTYLYSASVFKNIQIIEEEEELMFTYTDLIILAENEIPFRVDDFTVDPNIYGVNGFGDTANYVSSPTTRQNVFGGFSRGDVFFKPDGDTYELLLCQVMSLFGPYSTWVSSTKADIVPEGVYCGRELANAWLPCSTPFPEQEFPVLLFGGEYGTRINGVLIKPLLSERWGELSIYGSVTFNTAPSVQGVINVHYPEGLRKNSFGFFLDSEFDQIITGHQYSGLFVDDISYGIPVSITDIDTDDPFNPESQTVYIWPVYDTTQSYNEAPPIEEVTLAPLTKDFPYFVVSPYGNFSYNDFGIDNLAMVVPYKGRGFLGMKITGLEENLYTFDIYEFRLDKVKGTISEGKIKCSGSFNPTGLRAPTELRLRS